MIPDCEIEKAAQDGVDLRNYKRRPRMDYDTLEHELKLRKGTNHAKRK
jgi:hypothetical protein